MTCPTPSALANHIRYKHLVEKPFKCELCKYAGKTQHDVKAHLWCTFLTNVNHTEHFRQLLFEKARYQEQEFYNKEAAKDKLRDVEFKTENTNFNQVDVRPIR